MPRTSQIRKNTTGARETAGGFNYVVGNRIVKKNAVIITINVSRERRLSALRLFERFVVSRQ